MTIRTPDPNQQDTWQPCDVVINMPCDQCNDYPGVVVVLGEPYDWETATALVCRECLVSALAELDKYKESLK